jgi:N-acetylneuraminate synthase/sialic acid synthase
MAPTRTLTIGRTVIDDASDCYVIAEIGHNHQGDVKKARDMILAAKECGVNAVKLQKRNNKALYTRAMYDAPYMSENAYAPTYGAHRDALELPEPAFVELRNLARELGLHFFATAFDFPSLDFLASLDCEVTKIASGDVKTIPLIKRVAKLGKPLIVSTGGATLDDVKRVYDTVMPINPQLCLLQCTASYPCEPEDMNLRAITTLREAFPDVVVGLSDHQNGIALGPVAYVMGARVIEKHFTLNRAWKGTDQAFSLEPIGLRKLVRDLKRTRVALGDGAKRMLDCEKGPLLKMGKKLVAARDLPAGAVLTERDVALKSPGDGLPPYELDRVLGRTLRSPLKEDDNITLEGLA